MKKRILILIAVAAAGVVWALALGTMDLRRSMQGKAPVYFVAASNAPEKFRIVADWVCTGTNDEVEIQAAIDTAYAAGGGLVELSPGLFSVTKPSGATDVVFVADVLDGTNDATLVDNSALLDVTTGTFANIAIGQIFRASGGEDDGDNSVEDNVLDICFTIERKTDVDGLTEVSGDGDNPTILTKAGIETGVSVDDWVYILNGTNATAGWYQVDATGTNTITLDADAGTGAGADWVLAEALLASEDFLEDYGTDAGGSGDQPTFVRMISAIQLKVGVFVVGAGPSVIVGTAATEIRLAADSNCTMVSCEPTTQVGSGVQAGHSGTGMSNLLLNGNRGNQGSHVQYEFHPLCNGILLSDFIADTHFDRIVVEHMRGDCWKIDQPWGNYIGPGWTRFANGYGIIYGDGNDATLLAHKIYSTGEGDARDTHASNTCVGDGNTFSQGGVRLFGARRCKISPNICGGDRGYALRIRQSYNMVSNIGFITDTSTSDGAVLLEGGSIGNVITGCVFDNQVANKSGIVIDGVSAFVITNNTFAASTDPPIEMIGNFDTWGTIQGNIRCWLEDSRVGTGAVRAEMRSEKFKNTRGQALTLRTFCTRNAGSGTVTIAVGSNTDISPFGLVPTEIANDAVGDILVFGYYPKGPIDDAVGANNGALAVGEELSCSNNTQGTLEEAAVGDWIIAIAEEANAGALDGGVNYKAIYILPPAERYIKP